MKFFLRNFFLIFSIGFCSICCWIIFSLYYNRIGILSVYRVNGTNNNHSDVQIVKNTYKSSKLRSFKTISEVESKPNTLKRIRNIVCNINDEYKINCLKQQQSNEASIFIPFTFIRKYFDINGKIVRSKNQEEFEWNHSYSKVIYPDDKYSHIGKFLWFENYNVEIRDRVKCISAITNVPMSTQWFSSGHFYPTQIAQFGLSHFSKNISEPLPKIITLIESGVISKNIDNNQILNSKHDNYFEADNSTVLFLKKDLTFYPIVDTEVKIKDNIVIAFYIKNLINQEEIGVLYSTFERQHIVVNKPNKTVTFGIKGNVNSWFTLTRDLLIDLFKANLITNRKRNNFSLIRIEIEGKIQIKNLILKTSAHDTFAKAAGDWLLNNQNSRGGWDIKVKRKLSGGILVLKEGWHSSMAQGQAMSLLTRLYAITKQEKYLDAAKRALELFEIESYKNGVKALLFDKYIWYEEYPTVPSIFVLNGFIYSLFGLYDLSKSCDDPHCQKSQQLFDDGIQSLEAMLPLFDSGSGSFYDLRHLSLTIAPNIARWDYHSTHVNQLLYLDTIVRRDIFQMTAQRWSNYMKGHRAPHN